ncbi:hypothetical protein Egran_03477, partial [Elaphomyces granulatus]
MLLMSAIEHSHQNLECFFFDFLTCLLLYMLHLPSLLSSFIVVSILLLLLYLHTQLKHSQPSTWGPNPEGYCTNEFLIIAIPPLGNHEDPALSSE